MLYLPVLTSAAELTAGSGFLPRSPPASPVQLNAEGGTVSLGLKLALIVVFLTEQIGALRPASGTVLKQCEAPCNMIQLCWKNASPRCAEAAGLAAKPAPSPLTGGDDGPRANRIPRTAPEVGFLQ